MSTPLDIITRSLRTIGVQASAENYDPDDVNDAFELLNDLLDQWSNTPMMVSYKTEIIFDLVSGTYVYTIGPEERSAGLSPGLYPERRSPFPRSHPETSPWGRRFPGLGSLQEPG